MICACLTCRNKPEGSEWVRRAFGDGSKMRDARELRSGNKK